MLGTYGIYYDDTAKKIKGATFAYRKYIKAENKRPHCMFCWTPFQEGRGDDIAGEGYATLDREHWSCVWCFQQYQKRFDFQVVNAT